MICEEDLHTFVEQHCKDNTINSAIATFIAIIFAYLQYFLQMTDAERLKSVIEFVGISSNAFSQEVGYKRSEAIYKVLRGEYPINHKLALNVVTRYPNISLKWLLNGDGEMLTSGQDAIRPYKAYKYLEAHNLIKEPEEFYQKSGINEREFKLLEDGTHPDPVGAALKIAKAYPEVEFLFTSKPGEHNKKGKSKVIPYYDIEVSAGPISFYQDYPELPHTCMELPFVSDVDLAMPVYGDSMYPKIKNGDIVLLKKITDHNVIMYGEVYLVITNDYRTLKYVRKHPEDDKVLLVSENDRFDPVAIKKDAILHMFLYKGKFEKSQI